MNIGVDDKVGDTWLRRDLAIGIDGVGFGHENLS
jgi:hypothetical protein